MTCKLVQETTCDRCGESVASAAQFSQYPAQWRLPDGWADVRLGGVAGHLCAGCSTGAAAWMAAGRLREATAAEDDDPEAAHVARVAALVVRAASLWLRVMPRDDPRYAEIRDTLHGLLLGVRSRLPEIDKALSELPEEP